MKKILKGVCITSLSFALFLTLASATEIGHGICKIDGHKISFKVQKSLGSSMILNAKHQLTSNSSLNFHYNPFYDIGGSVYLQVEQDRKMLLLWNNGFQDPITEGSVMHNGQYIECSISI